MRRKIIILCPKSVRNWYILPIFSLYYVSPLSLCTFERPCALPTHTLLVITFLYQFDFVFCVGICVLQYTCAFYNVSPSSNYFDPMWYYVLLWDWYIHIYIWFYLFLRTLDRCNAIHRVCSKCFCYVWILHFVPCFVLFNFYFKSAAIKYILQLLILTYCSVLLLLHSSPNLCPTFIRVIYPVYHYMLHNSTWNLNFGYGYTPVIIMAVTVIIWAVLCLCWITCLLILW